MKTERAKNNIPEGWKMTTLGKVAEVKHGFAFSGNNITDAENENILLTPGNFLIGGGWKEGKKYFNGDIPNNYILAADDLIITMTDLSKEGDTLGYPALIPYNPTKKFLHNQRIGIVIINENFAIKKYIYFLMRFSGYQRFIVNTASGSTVKHTSPSKIKSYNFAMPPLLEQQAIAAVLSSLDDKIELLREQNKTLEKVAQAIFKRWFIDFEFPDKNGNLYKSSGGKMIESELGDIPEGWRGEKITELFDFIKGVEPGADNYSKYKMSDNYIPFYRVQNISGNGNNNMPDIFIEKSLSYGKIFEEDDILVSLDGTIGKVFIGGSGSYSSGIRKVVVNKTEINQCLSYCFLKSDYFQNGLVLFSSGETTIKHAGKALENLKIAYSKDIFKKFSEITNPIFEKMVFNLKQIQTLSALRDSLLPRLMSGKIRVNGFGD